jgi:hypothetical protein
MNDAAFAIVKDDGEIMVSQISRLGREQATKRRVTYPAWALAREKEMLEPPIDDQRDPIDIWIEV